MWWTVSSQFVTRSARLKGKRVREKGWGKDVTGEGGAVRRGLIAGCGEHRPIMMMMMMIYDDADDDSGNDDTCSNSW